jgi:4-aminobutyrate aminotransferase
MLVLGKGLGGGIMPMAALVARPDLDVAADRAIGHYTHEKSPVGCAAALATLDVIEAEGLLARARDLGAHAMERLEDTARRHATVTAVRGLGLYLGVEIGRRDTPEAEAMAERILYRCLDHGLSFKLGGGNTITLCPPLTIARSDLDLALDILEAAIAAEGA